MIVQVQQIFSIFNFTLEVIINNNNPQDETANGLVKVTPEERSKVLEAQEETKSNKIVAFDDSTPKDYFDDGQMNLNRDIDLDTKSNEGRKIFHYVIHIPKTGGTYFSNQANKLLLSDKHSNADRPWLCDVGVKSHDYISSFPEAFPRTGRRRKNCTAFIAESDYNERADYTYTILREPTSHVLSQYFHCKEAPVHTKKKRELMPSLDEWLQYWHNHMDEAKKLEKDRDELFKCYIPVNMQSKLLNLNHTRIFGDNEDAAIKEIESRFTILGDTSQMTKTKCSIVAAFSGIVPTPCNCTHLKRRRLNDHGVIHHGNTFNATVQQRKLIDEITKVDQQLYRYSKVIFARQVEKLEKDFGVKICN